MTKPPTAPKDNRRIIAQTISGGHSFYAHASEFNQEELGRIIDISFNGQPHPVALGVYIERSLSSPSTQVFTETPKGIDKLPTSYIYNSQDNTLIVLDANNTKDFGTIYRPKAGREKFERIREHAGSPPIKYGPNAINDAIYRFEEAIHKNSPECIQTLQRTAKSFGLKMRPFQEAAAIQPKTTHAQKASPKKDFAAEAHNSEKAPPVIEPKVEAVLNDTDNTVSFWADKNGRVTHYFNERSNSVVSLSPSGQCLKAFKNAQDAFDYFAEKINESTPARGNTPDIVSGGHPGLSQAYKNVTGKTLSVGEDLQHIAKQLQRINATIGRHLSDAISQTMQHTKDTNPAEDYSLSEPA